MWRIIRSKTCRYINIQETAQTWRSVFIATKETYSPNQSNVTHLSHLVMMTATLSEKMSAARLTGELLDVKRVTRRHKWRPSKMCCLCCYLSSDKTWRQRVGWTSKPTPLATRYLETFIRNSSACQIHSLRTEGVGTLPSQQRLRQQLKASDSIKDCRHAHPQSFQKPVLQKAGSHWVCAHLTDITHLYVIYAPWFWATDPHFNSVFSFYFLTKDTDWNLNILIDFLCVLVVCLCTYIFLCACVKGG